MSMKQGAFPLTYTIATLVLTWSMMGIGGNATTHNVHIVHHSLGSTEDADGSDRDKGWVPVHDTCGTDLAIPKVIAPTTSAQQYLQWPYIKLKIFMDYRVSTAETMRG